MAQLQPSQWDRLRRRLMVLLDDSPESIAALQVAVAQARRLGAGVEVICVFGNLLETIDDMTHTMRRFRDTYGPGQVMPAPEEPIDRVVGARAERSLRRAFPHGYPDVPLRVILRLGTHGDIVFEVPSGADLLIVETAHDRRLAAQGGAR